MIFVALGTWDMPFTRPLIEIENAVKDGIIKEQVIVQSGKTDYNSRYMKLVPFFDQEELQKHYEEASLIICQAGVGSIMLGLKKRKKVIAIARLKKNHEHIDDHQTEILHVFSVNNYILPWQGEGDLKNILQNISSFNAVSYPFHEEKISDAIIDYLNNTFKKKR